jgi:flagellar FliJ protein
MKKFQFDLQKLLEYRKTVEEQLLAELSGMRMEKDREIIRLQNLCTSVDMFRERMKKNLTGGTPEEIREDFCYLTDLNLLVESQKTFIVKLEEKIQRKTAEVVSASKEVKALERLKERKRQAYKKEIQEQEQKFLDELASIRYSRSGAGDECVAESAA